MGKKDRLKVQQAAREFRDRVLEVVRGFPRGISLGLGVQLAEAARSVSSNIAEGLGRGTIPDQLHFLRMANGSLEEAQDQLREAVNARLIERKEFYREWNRSVVISKMLVALIAERENRS